MHGYIANTDYDWYRFLRSQPDLDEVNFWQPSGSRGFHAIRPNEPFFFKLKSPHYAIGGYGFFAHASSRVPVSLAWEAFEAKNGAATQEEMRRRIARYRATPPRPFEDPLIGCLMIANPVFFDERDWVPQPRDWPANAVQGKTYDLDAGEGRRVWEECRLLSGPALATDGVRDVLAQADRPRFGAPVEIRPRLGQGIFRVAVLDAYGRACAVTGEHSLPVLEAAHIQPYKSGGAHELRNGLLLRSDLHRLFDKGFVTVTPDRRFRVSLRLKDLWRNGKTYYPLEGREIRLPERKELWPDPTLLEWHAETMFQR
ncbi:MAG: HNH endonuclease [Acidobacteria bacterium]|nr:HNH endonuclease [Acidobacteriota bacterium]